MPHLSTISNYQIVLDKTKKIFFTFEKSRKSLFGLNNKKIRLEIFIEGWGIKAV